MFGDAAAYERFMGRWSRLLAPLLVDFTGVPDTGQRARDVVRLNGGPCTID